MFCLNKLGGKYALYIKNLKRPSYRSRTAQMNFHREHMRVPRTQITR